MGGSRSLLAILVFTSLMIVDNLDAFCRVFAPDEADLPLIVDPDTMLTLLFRYVHHMGITGGNTRASVTEPVPPPCASSHVARFAGARVRRRYHFLTSGLRNSRSAPGTLSPALIAFFTSATRTFTFCLFSLPMTVSSRRTRVRSC